MSENVAPGRLDYDTTPNFTESGSTPELRRPGATFSDISAPGPFRDKDQLNKFHSLLYKLFMDDSPETIQHMISFHYVSYQINTSYGSE